MSNKLIKGLIKINSKKKALFSALTFSLYLQTEKNFLAKKRTVSLF